MVCDVMMTAHVAVILGSAAPQLHATVFGFLNHDHMGQACFRHILIAIFVSVRFLMTMSLVMMMMVVVLSE